MDDHPLKNTRGHLKFVRRLRVLPEKLAVVALSPVHRQVVVKSTLECLVIRREAFAQNKNNTSQLQDCWITLNEGEKGPQRFFDLHGSLFSMHLKEYWSVPQGIVFNFSERICVRRAGQDGAQCNHRHEILSDQDHSVLDKQLVEFRYLFEDID